MIATVILLTVLATAIISGILGMAGGLALMAVLTSLLPVSGAMILHGAVQAASNGARFVFLRDRMMWGVLPWFRRVTGPVILALGALCVAKGVRELLLAG